MLSLTMLPLFLLSVLLDALSFNLVAQSEARSVVINLQRDVLEDQAGQQSSTHSHFLSRRAKDLESLAPTSDSSSYYTLMSFGNITFRVALDTGSADLWLLSSACTSSQCKSIPSYPLSYKSPSFGIINGNQTTFNLTFADSTNALGYVATESVQLDNFSVPNQVFGLVNTTTVSLKSMVSGVLGLGFPRLSKFSTLTTNGTPFVSRLAQQGQLDYPMFGISVTRNSSGTLSLGAIDIDVVQNVSNIEWNRVVPFSPFGVESNTSRYLQWAIELNGIGVNGTNVTPQPTYPTITGKSIALLDIGSNGIFGPYQDVSAIFNLIEGARLVDANVGQWAVPCGIDQVMSFNFGRRNFTLQPTDFIIGPTSGESSLCLAWPRAIQDVGDGIDWELGTPFLRTVYSVYSFGIDRKEPPMIGLYPLSNITTLNQTAPQITSFLASASPTVATTLPNSLLTSTPPTPLPYLFNTSVPASVGDIVASELGTSTYSPLLTGSSINATALPVITASPTLATLIITDGTMVFTSTSFAPTTSIALGRPPGFSAAATIAPPRSSVVITQFLSVGLPLLLVITHGFGFL